MVTSGQATKMAVTPFDPPYSKLHACTQILWLCVLSNRSYGRLKYCGNRDFGRFGSFDLDLDPMTFIYELDPYCLEL